MRDEWYADKRDLIKWGVLFHLVRVFNAVRILQVAYYRASEFGQLVIDGQECEIPYEIIAHFRNLRKIGGLSSKVQITVFDSVFQDRVAYLRAVLALLPTFRQERLIVFLDPDTGLEPGTPNLKHVLNSEARAIWDAMKSGDVFAIYQHQTTYNSRQPWIEPKRSQLADSLAVPTETVKIASGPAIAQDVVLFYTQRA